MFQIVYYTSLGTGVLWHQKFISRALATNEARAMFPRGFVIVPEGTNPREYV